MTNTVLDAEVIRHLDSIETDGFEWYQGRDEPKFLTIVLNLNQMIYSEHLHIGELQRNPCWKQAIQHVITGCVLSDRQITRYFGI